MSNAPAVRRRAYNCPHIGADFELNGKLDNPAWAKGAWTDEFVDIQGDHMPHPRFRTRAKMLWSDKCLYIGAELDEPHVWGTLTERDSVIFHDNDFEVFVDPDRDNHLYAELEINALNTVWDLILVKPYRDGGPAVNGWDIKGLRTAVHIDGTLNDAGDVDHGWSVEIAIPFAALGEIARTSCPPHEGDLWHINFSRVEWLHTVVAGKYVKVPNKPEDNWVWSPQGVIDMHRPQRWGLLQFVHSEQPLPTEEPKRDILWDLSEAQKEFRGKHGRWATSLGELGGQFAGVLLEATTHQFEASLGGWRINHEARIWKG